MHEPQKGRIECCSCRGTAQGNQLLILSRQAKCQTSLRKYMHVAPCGALHHLKLQAFHIQSEQ
eukprot:1991565-Amphidinium_carterae.1